MDNDELIDWLEEGLPSMDDDQIERIYHLCWVELLDRGIRHLEDEEFDEEDNT